MTRRKPALTARLRRPTDWGENVWTPTPFSSSSWSFCCLAAEDSSIGVDDSLTTAEAAELLDLIETASPLDEGGDRNTEGVALRQSTGRWVAQYDGTALPVYETSSLHARCSPDLAVDADCSEQQCHGCEGGQERCTEPPRCQFFVAHLRHRLNVCDYSEAARRGSRAAAPRQAGRATADAQRGTGEEHRRRPAGAL